MPSSDMPTEAQSHLAWEASSTATNQITSDRLPEEVAACLQNARFLHLATCTQNHPHVSLMNYTYLPPSTRPTLTPSAPPRQLPTGPTIIMTSNPSSKKTTNLLQNPNVSLLVHDWVSTRPPHVTSNGPGGRDASPTGARATSLANMLMQMNSAAVSSISATINGSATVLEAGSEEERWCKEQHLANNTFSQDDATSRPRFAAQQRALSVQADSTEDLFGLSPSNGRAGDGGRGSYIEDEDVRVVVVRIRDGRISDWKGGVKDWVIRDANEEDVDGVVDGLRS